MNFKRYFYEGQNQSFGLWITFDGQLYRIAPYAHISFLLANKELFDPNPSPPLPQSLDAALSKGNIRVNGEYDVDGILNVSVTFSNLVTRDAVKRIVRFAKENWPKDTSFLLFKKTDGNTEEVSYSNFVSIQSPRQFIKTAEGFKSDIRKFR